MKHKNYHMPFYHVNSFDECLSYVKLNYNCPNEKWNRSMARIIRNEQIINQKGFLNKLENL